MKSEEGRGKREEGRGKREEGRGKRKWEEGSPPTQGTFFLIGKYETVGFLRFEV